MKKIFILLISLLLGFSFAQAQESHRWGHVSFELGITSNTLDWEVTLPSYHTTFDRNRFFLFPSFKLKYNLPLARIGNNFVFELAPFVGYNMFGGKSKTVPNDYHDIVYLQAIEMGILPTIVVNNKMRFYGGVKGQYILSANIKSFGTIPVSIKHFEMVDTDTAEAWYISRFRDFFKDFSYSLGVGGNYKFSRFYLGAEAWFGMTNLARIIHAFSFM